MCPSGRRVARSPGWTVLAALPLAVAAMACSRDRLPTTPDAESIRVSVATTGEDLDVDGYEVVLDGVVTGKLTSVAEFSSTTGIHSVELTNVASNCTVSDPSPRRIDLSANQIATVDFTVECRGTGIDLFTRTTGDILPGSYMVVVDSQLPQKVSPTGIVRIRLPAGRHSVELSAPDQCVAAEGDRRGIVVAAGAYVDVAFDLTCGVPVRREKIAYVNSGSAFSGTVSVVETVNADGSNPLLVGVGDAPSWSRDGTRILYLDTEAATRDPIDWDPGLVLRDPEMGSVTGLPVPSDADFPRQGAMSPARDEVVLEYRRVGYDFSGLATIDLTRPYAIPMFLKGVTSAEQPSWSPDGERIVFVCRRLANNADLCVVGRDGTGLVPLTNDAENDVRPAWSPDGKTIAFTRFSGTDPRGSIALLDLATGAITSLGYGMDPAWSPDGSKLVYAESDGLFVMNRDGSGRTRLTTGPHRAPSWRPAP